MNKVKSTKCSEFPSQVREKAIVYMVAGLSSRFGGKIKQFAQIGPNNETLIEYSVNQAISAGFTKIIFIVGEKTEEGFKGLFKDSYHNLPVYYAYQGFNPELRDKPWGTTDALCCAKEIINCPFVVCNGDDIYGKNTFKVLADHLDKNDKEAATIGYKLVEVLPENGKVNRGIFQIENGYVKKITETFNITKANLNELSLNKNNLCSQNIFALYPDTLKILYEKSEAEKKLYPNDRKKELLLPVYLSDLASTEKIRIKVYNTPDKWFGVTNPEDEEIVRAEIKKLHLNNPSH